MGTGDYFYTTIVAFSMLVIFLFSWYTGGQKRSDHDDHGNTKSFERTSLAGFHPISGIRGFHQHLCQAAGTERRTGRHRSDRRTSNRRSGAFGKKLLLPHRHGHLYECNIAPRCSARRNHALDLRCRTICLSGSGGLCPHPSSSPDQMGKRSAIGRSIVGGDSYGTVGRSRQPKGGMGDRRHRHQLLPAA